MNETRLALSAAKCRPVILVPIKYGRPMRLCGYSIRAALMVPFCVNGVALIATIITGVPPVTPASLQSTSSALC